MSINEIVCGIRFDSIKQLQSGHLGILWQKFRSDFPSTEDHNLVGPVSEEDIGTPNKIPLPRVWFVHRNEDELMQGDILENCPIFFPSPDLTLNSLAEGEADFAWEERDVIIMSQSCDLAIEKKMSRGLALPSIESFRTNRGAFVY